MLDGHSRTFTIVVAACLHKAAQCNTPQYDPVGPSTAELEEPVADLPKPNDSGYMQSLSLLRLLLWPSYSISRQPVGSLCSATMHTHAAVRMTTCISSAAYSKPSLLLIQNLDMNLHWVARQPLGSPCSALIHTGIRQTFWIQFLTSARCRSSGGPGGPSMQVRPSSSPYTVF